MRVRLDLGILLAGALATSLFAQGQQQSVVLERGNSTIVLEPYAPNILRVTLSLQKENATAAPGYGFVGTPSAEGWSHTETEGADVYSSPRMVVTVGGRPTGKPSNWKPVPSQVDIAKFFNGSTPGANISFATPDGTKLVHMEGWQQSVPNYKDGNAEILNQRRKTDPEFFQVGATFASPDDEHYYGLGENQEGYLDHRGHTIDCWQNYLATGGPTSCVPFLVTNKGYGLIWDNPSRTTIEPGFQ